jgi:hypothetical protein
MKTEENKTEEKVCNKEDYKKHFKRKKIGFGITIIALGSLLLINEIYPNCINFNYVWPSLLILGGLKAIFKPIRQCHPHRIC